MSHPAVKAVRAAGERLAALVERVDTRRVDMAISILVTLLALAVFASLETRGSRLRAAFSFLENIELQSLDARFVMRGAREPDPRIVIVGIDEKTLHKVGAWPIPRNAYAELIDRLSAGGAKVVAFDITFPTPEKNSAVEALKRLEAEVQGTAPPQVIAKIREIQGTSDNDVILAESMRRAGNVILGHIFLDKERAQSMDERAAEDYYNVLWGRPFPQMQKLEGDFDLSAAWHDPARAHDGRVEWGIESNIRLLAEAAASYGFFNNYQDADGTMRRAALLVRYRDREWFPSLPFEAVRMYENIKEQSTVGYMSENGLERIEFGPHTVFTNWDGSALINYAGPYLTYPHYSMADVVDGTVPAEEFKGKIVLVGAAAVGIGDLRVTPFQTKDYMGVEIHANVVDNLLHTAEPGLGFLTRRATEVVFDAAFILLFGLGMGYLFARARPFVSTLSVMAALLVFGAVVYLAFARWGMWLTFVLPASTLILNYAAVTSFRMITEEREKRKIRRSFAQYVSPGVIGLIEKDPKKYFRPGGEMKELTIMFSDIRSFTTISEGMTPDELVLLLNEYLGEMTDILFKHWGTLDKYIGDAIMAFWGSPYPQEDHALRACSCLLEMGARLDELNLKWEIEGRKQLAIGMGVNTGPVNVGNMGSSKRLAWTVMGDHVNLASRLEGQTKDYKVRIIAGENTYHAARDQFVFRELDRIRVKGKLKPVAIFELLAPGKDAPAYADLLGQFAAGLAAYRRQEWDEAVQRFEALLSRYPDDGPAHTFLKRSHEYRVEAPARDWDGVYVAKSK